MRKTYTIRIKLKGGWRTSIQVSGNNMTEKEAFKYGYKAMKKNPDAVGIDKVYEVK